MGKILNIAKCVQPARAFVGRMLHSLRHSSGGSVPLDDEFRADLDWFKEFLPHWQGKFIFTPADPIRSMAMDASMRGIGGADDRVAYSHTLTPQQRLNNKILELETLNVLVGIHTMLRPTDVGHHIRIYCDNESAVRALKSGRAHNPTVMRAARSLWMLQAFMNVTLSYVHIPGHHNNLPDALSRQGFSAHSKIVADRMVAQKGLTRVMPCMYVFDNPEYLTC